MRKVACAEIVCPLNGDVVHLGHPLADPTDSDSDAAVEPAKSGI